MKSALLYSFCFHIAVGFIWMKLISFKPVRIVPRDVMTVHMVSLESPKPELETTPMPEPEEIEPPAPEPAKDDEPEEEPLPPPEKPKPKKKKEEKKEVKKVQPEPELKQTAQSTEAKPDESTTQPATGDMTLDAEDFPFMYYLTNIKRKIAAYWRVPQQSAGDDKHCVVYFRIARDGSVQSPSVETSSGNFLFDQAALRAVVQSNPMPPLPDGFVDSYLGVHFSFAYVQQ